MDQDDQLYIDKKLAEFEAALLRSNKPPWGLFMSIIGLGFAVVGAFYTAIILPLHGRMDKFEQHLDSYSQETLHDHTELLKRWQDLHNK